MREPSDWQQSSGQIPRPWQAQQIAELFLEMSMIWSARPSCYFSFATSCSRLSTPRSAPLPASDLGPRGLLCKVANSIASTSCRQLFKCELYNPSRRNSADCNGTHVTKLYRDACIVAVAAILDGGRSNPRLLGQGHSLLSLQLDRGHAALFASASIVINVGGNSIMRLLALFVEL